MIDLAPFLTVDRAALGVFEVHANGDRLASVVIDDAEFELTAGAELRGPEEKERECGGDLSGHGEGKWGQNCRRNRFNRRYTYSFHPSTPEDGAFLMGEPEKS